MKNQAEQLGLMQKHLIENAFDFLERAVDEFEDNPKYSIIHFAFAVEQFLKARLMMEHWTLIIAPNSSTQEPRLDWDRFKQGRCKSIGLDDCFERLEGVTRIAVSKADQECFKALADHRNKVIHYYHDELVDEKSDLAAEQTRCWYALNSLITKRWPREFDFYLERLVSVESKMKKQRSYLEQVYQNAKPKIEGLIEGDYSIRNCPACDHEAFLEEPILEDCIYRERCLICGHESVTSSTQSGNYQIDDPTELLAELDYDEDEIEFVGHCVDCDALGSVISIGDKYLCLICFDLFDQMECCECGAWNTRLPPNSGSLWLGCVECDGYQDNSR